MEASRMQQECQRAISELARQQRLPAQGPNAQGPNIMSTM